VTPFYPSGFNAPNIISVAATDNRDQLVASSNFGQSSVDLGAPGRDIASTHPTQTYVFETGTSMSAAVVSGAAGLVLSGCPGLTTTQLRANLISGVDVVPALQSKTASGGRLNEIVAAVYSAQRWRIGSRRHQC
jgi:subtilisin family serine protease